MQDSRAICLKAQDLTKRIQFRFLSSLRELWSLLILLGLIGTSSAGNSVVLGGPGPYNLDLDGPPGDYEARYIPVSGSSFTVKGAIRFVEKKHDKRYAPLAAVELMGPNSAYNVGLEVFVFSSAANYIQFAVRNRGVLDLPDVAFARTDFTSNSIPFEVKLADSGEVLVTIGSGGEAKTGKVYSVRRILPEITRVRIVASTARVQFSNVQIIPGG